jgi:hypothetical protein
MCSDVLPSDDVWDWLPENGVAFPRGDLERILVVLRALVSDTDRLDPRRAYAVEIAFVITTAIERGNGVDE